LPLAGFIRRWLRTSPHVEPVALTDEAWREVEACSQLVAALAAPERSRLRQLTRRFLTQKHITGAAGFEPDALQCRLIAALCCLPALRLPADSLDGWHQVIVYPGQFRVHRQQHDETTGVVAEWEDDLSGESWDRGPLVLSWADIEAELGEPDAGYCVVVHEIAHKLDALDGAMNGTPLLPRAQLGAWVRDFEAAFAALVAAVEAGHETAIDPYAAECPEEFFAVVSEYHFSAPDLLQQEMPAVAAHLVEFYGPPPLPALASAG
jgi:Mlc titration factor MtfA (ptsG expression regulator)